MSGCSSEAERPGFRRGGRTESKSVTRSKKGIKMEKFKCDSCDMFYYTDSHEGFDCDYCPGKLVKIEESEYFPGNFVANVDYPCVSC